MVVALERVQAAAPVVGPAAVVGAPRLGAVEPGTHAMAAEA